MSTLLTKMQQSRAAKKADLDLLLEKSTPTADDATRAEGLIAEIRDLDAGIAAQAEADERRAAILRSHSEKYGDGIESGADLVNASASPYGPVRVMSEPSTYTERGERQGGPSFLVDLFRAEAAYARALSVWLGDDSEDMAMTMAALDTALARGASIMKTLERCACAGRAGRSAREASA